MTTNLNDLTIAELTAINDELSAKRESIRLRQLEIRAVLNVKLKDQQVLARYQGKVKPEDFDTLRRLGKLPDTPGQVVLPPTITAGLSVKPPTSE
jgi:hypothetical protein